MSVPTSLRVGPFTATVLVKKRYLFFYILLIWLSLISVLLEFWVYWQLTWDYIRPLHFYIFLPLLCIIMYMTIVPVSLIFAKILLLIVNKFHPPREGVFIRDIMDKDYRYWSIRNTIKRWPIWLSHRFPFPFFDNLCFKMFGVKTTFKNSLFEGYVDTEFIEFGTNVVVGQASHVLSSMIIGNLLIIKKTIIEDNVRIGAHSVVMAGTHIKKNAVLAANSTTTASQVLEEGWIYVGIPATKYKKNLFFEDNLQYIIKHVEDIEGLRAKYDEIYTKLSTKFEKKEASIFSKERREIRKEEKENEEWRKEMGI